jgi:hypothetical protein
MEEYFRDQGAASLARIRCKPQVAAAELRAFRTDLPRTPLSGNLQAELSQPQIPDSVILRQSYPNIACRESGAASTKQMAIDMSDAPDQRLLEALLDSWDRNNTILLNLLRALPEGGLAASAMQGSRCIAELFTHIHFVRLVFVFEDAPEFARNLPGGGVGGGA